jgi:hypothetical protein
MARYEILHKTALTVADHARAILPPTDVHGIDQVQQYFGVTYTEQQLIELVDLPWPDEVLKECAGTHLLVAGCSLSIGEVKEKHCGLFGQNSPCWYNNQPFAHDERLGCKWYLLRKDWVPRSYHKRLNDQVKLLPPEEEVPLACEVTYVTILHRLVTGEWLHVDRYVRTSSHAKDGDRVTVGVRLQWGLCLGDIDDAPHQIGLAYHRKLP